MGILFYFGATIVLEFLVLLLFFGKERGECLRFAILVNAITWPLGTYAFHQWQVNWFVVEGLIFAAEAVAVYFYWNVSPPKALLVSIVANGLTAGIFPLLHWFGVDYPF